VRVGSLFTGYGGLDMAVGGTLQWVSDIEPAACHVLEQTRPGVPNLGDVTLIDWTHVAPVDVLTAGYPCQPFSHAGKREGSNDDRHLWPFVADAIRHLRPGRVVLENVRGHYSLGLADVIGDLAGMGYDARWGCVRASDAGAPHVRARVFIIANPNGSRLEGINPRVDVATARGAAAGHPAQGADGVASDADRIGYEQARRPAPGETRESHAAPDRCDRIPAGVEWGRFGPAIDRWGLVLGRPAPAPSYIGKSGRPRLNPVFVEWMMGLPEGWVTGHGLSQDAALKMLGNGVVPQQARLALELLETMP
jgi:DNA (cytosine-5)-methyltransferase 1